MGWFGVMYRVVLATGWGCRVSFAFRGVRTGCVGEEGCAGCARVLRTVSELVFVGEVTRRAHPGARGIVSGADCVCSVQASGPAGAVVASAESWRGVVPGRRPVVVCSGRGLDALFRRPPWMRAFVCSSGHEGFWRRKPQGRAQGVAGGARRGTQEAGIAGVGERRSWARGKLGRCGQVPDVGRAGDRPRSSIGPLTSANTAAENGNDPVPV